MAVGLGLELGDVVAEVEAGALRQPPATVAVAPHEPRGTGRLQNPSAAPEQAGLDLGGALPCLGTAGPGQVPCRWPCLASPKPSAEAGPCPWP